MPPAAPPTDEALLDRARQGDAEAFQRLVERYEGKVAATVVGMLGPGPDADDVGQETFIRFYRALGRFRGDSSLGTYLTRIAINESLKALKRRQTWRQRFFSRDDEAAPPEPIAEGEAPMREQERKDAVQQALQRLSPAHRAVVVLRLLEGYSTRETAALLGLPEGTVMSRLSRALEKLAPLLEPLR